MKFQQSFLEIYLGQLQLIEAGKQFKIQGYNLYLLLNHEQGVKSLGLHWILPGYNVSLFMFIATKQVLRYRLVYWNSSVTGSVSASDNMEPKKNPVLDYLKVEPCAKGFRTIAGSGEIDNVRNISFALRRDYFRTRIWMRRSSCR